MDATEQFLKLYNPSDWTGTYLEASRIAAEITGLGWPQRCRRLSDELETRVCGRFGTLGVVAIVAGRADANDAGTPSREAIEETVRLGRILVTAVLLKTGGRERPDIGVPYSVAHALTLSLSLVPAWGHAAQEYLERWDGECDDALTTLPGYMLTMLADDFGRTTTRGKRVRTIWTQGISGARRSGPVSMMIH